MESSTSPKGKPDRREQARLMVAGIAGVLITLFALFNFNRVEVDWILFSVRTPLIVVIVVSALLGALVDRGVQWRARRRRRP